MAEDRAHELRMVVGQASMDNIAMIDNEVVDQLFETLPHVNRLVEMLCERGVDRRTRTMFLIGLAVNAAEDE